MAQYELVFILTQQDTSFYPEASKKTLGFFKKQFQGFFEDIPFKRLTNFNVTIVGNFDYFNVITLKPAH